MTLTDCLPFLSWPSRLRSPMKLSYASQLSANLSGAHSCESIDLLKWQALHSSATNVPIEQESLNRHPMPLLWRHLTDSSIPRVQRFPPSPTSLHSKSSNFAPYSHNCHQRWEHLVREVPSSAVGMVRFWRGGSFFPRRALALSIRQVPIYCWMGRVRVSRKTYTHANDST